MHLLTRINGMQFVLTQNTLLDSTLVAILLIVLPECSTNTRKQCKLVACKTRLNSMGEGTVPTIKISGVIKCITIVHTCV